MTNDDIDLLQQLIMHGGTQAFDLVPLALKKVIIEKQWQHRSDKDGNNFLSFEAFVTHRRWQGLESTIDDLRIFCRKQPEVRNLILNEMEPGRSDGGDRRSESFQSDNVTLKRGNSALYTLKRLKRDRPDLFQQVLGGDLTANQAAIEAEFRKKKTPLESFFLLVPKFSENERKEAIKKLCPDICPECKKVFGISE